MLVILRTLTALKTREWNESVAASGTTFTITTHTPGAVG